MTKLDLFKKHLSDHGFTLIEKEVFGVYKDYKVKLNVMFFNLPRTIKDLRKFNIYQITLDSKRDDVLTLNQEDYNNEYT